MITSIVIVVFLILVVAYFRGNSEENSSRRERRASGKSDTIDRQVFDVVKIDNPKVILPENNTISDQDIESFNNEGVAYQISISQMTCSCPDFQKHRKGVEVNDPRRICKHIYEVLKKNSILSSQTELVLAILESSPKNKKLTTVRLSSGNEVVICHGGNEWVNVFTRKRKKRNSGGLYTGKYDCFGFNVNEARWSYGDGPPGAREIRSIISQII